MLQGFRPQGNLAKAVYFVLENRLPVDLDRVAVVSFERGDWLRTGVSELFIFSGTVLKFDGKKFTPAQTGDVRLIHISNSAVQSPGVLPVKISPGGAAVNLRIDLGAFLSARQTLGEAQRAVASRCSRFGPKIAAKVISYLKEDRSTIKVTDLSDLGATFFKRPTESLVLQEKAQFITGTLLRVRVDSVFTKRGSHMFRCLNGKFIYAEFVSGNEDKNQSFFNKIVESASVVAENSRVLSRSELPPLVEKMKVESAQVDMVLMTVFHFKHLWTQKVLLVNVDCKSQYFDLWALPVRFSEGNFWISPSDYSGAVWRSFSDEPTSGQTALEFPAKTEFLVKGAFIKVCLWDHLGAVSI